MMQVREQIARITQINIAAVERDSTGLQVRFLGLNNREPQTIVPPEPFEEEDEEKLKEWIVQQHGNTAFVGNAMFDTWVLIKREGLQKNT